MVEDEARNYLKLGHNYYDKYCLYLYTTDGTFLKKVVANLDEAVKIVSSFYNGADIKEGFESEFILHAQRHFIEKDFIAYPDSSSCIIFTFVLYYPLGFVAGR
jgi:hypothetical protein